jgi:TP901 family phage tail tape measure protein
METKVLEIRVKDKATPAIKKIDKALNKTEKNVAKTGKTANKSFSGLNNTLGVMPASIQRIVGGLQTLKVALISTGIGALVVAAGSLVGLFISATKKGSEFAKSMSGLKAVTGATEKEMNALANSAKELGSTTEFTAMEVASLQTELAKLGFPTADILDMSEATLNLASSMGISLGEAAAFTGSTLRAFGLEATDSKEVIDILAQSTSSSALDFNKLNTALTTVAPIAKTANVSLSETTAMLGTLANSGFDASTSGTALRNIFLTLAQEGLTMEQAFAKINNATDKNVVALDLFDKRGAGVAITLAENAEATGQLLNELNGATDAFNGLGAAAGIAETRLDNLDGDTTKLGSAWEGFLLSVEDGEGIFSSIARGFVQGLTNIVSTLTFVSKVTGAFFKEIRETAGISISVIKTGIKNALKGIQSSFLSFKETIADVPFIGKAIDKEKLKKDREALNESLAKANEDAKYWAGISKKRAEEGNIFERTLNRLKQKEQERIDRELAESNKIKSDANIEGLEEEEKATRDLIKIKEAELKAILDTEATTKKELAVRNEKVKAIQNEIKELQNLRTAKFAIEKIDFEEMPKLEKREAKKIEVRTNTEDQVDKYVRKVKKERTRDDVIREEEAHQRRMAEANTRIDIASNALGSIGQLADAFARGDKERAKKAFKINKAVGIAQATISTAQGIMNAYSHPVDVATGMSFAQIMLLCYGLAGAAQIATISATRFDSGGGAKPTTTDSTGGGSLTTQAPSFNVVGQSGFNQVASALGTATTSTSICSFWRCNYSTTTTKQYNTTSNFLNKTKWK